MVKYSNKPRPGPAGVDPNRADRCGVRMVHAERVERARREALGRRELSRLSLIYKALADPTRLRIVLALKDGEMCVCDLAALLDLSDSAVSHQLRRLRELALVRNRRQGQVLYYSLDDDHVADLLRVGLEHSRE